jgi:hypothetical protein
MARKGFGGKRPPLQTWTNPGGYRKFRDPSTGRAEYTHIRVAEKKVGGKIFPGYEVHHKDGDKTNNRPENLAVLTDAAHRAIHRRGK